MSLFDSDLMASQASHGDGGVYELALGFVFVTLETRRGIDFRLKRDGMDGTEKLRRAKKHQPQAQENPRNPASAAKSSLLELNVW